MNTPVGDRSIPDRYSIEIAGAVFEVVLELPVVDQLPRRRRGPEQQTDQADSSDAVARHIPSSNQTSFAAERSRPYALAFEAW